MAPKNYSNLSDDELDTMIGSGPRAASAPASKSVTWPDRLDPVAVPTRPKVTSAAPTGAASAASADLSPEEVEDLDRKLGVSGKREVKLKLRPDMDDDQILRSIGYDPAVVKRSKYYKPGMFRSSLSKPEDAEGWRASFVGDIARGMRDPFDAAMQGVARVRLAMGKEAPEDVALVDARLKLGEVDWQENIRHGADLDPDTGEAKFNIPRILGSGLVFMPSVGPVKAAGAAAPFVANLGRAALGGALGAATSGRIKTSPDVGGEEDTYWSDLAEKGTAGAFGGALMHGLSEGVARGLGRAINARKGVIAPDYEGAAEIEALSRKHKTRVSFGDATRDPFARRAEIMSEQGGPLGMTPFRKEQRGEAATEASRIGVAARDEMRAEKWEGLAEIRREARAGKENAIEILDEIKNLPDDDEYAKILQLSGKIEPIRRKAVVRKLYDEVRDLSGDLEVPPTNTLTVLKRELKRLQEDDAPDEKTIQYLANLKKRLEGKDDGIGVSRHGAHGGHGAEERVLSPVDRALLAPEKEPMVANQFERRRRLRSRLGRDAASDEIIGTEGNAILMKLRRAVTADMKDAIEKSGDSKLLNKWRKADRYYREELVPFKDKTLAKALTNANYDEIFGALVRRGKGVRAERFLNALPEKGREAVRYGFIMEAMKRATDPDTQLFSPLKFAGYFRNFEDAYGKFYKGQQKWEMDGFLKLMRHIERAGQFDENPPTGNRLIPWLVATSQDAAPNFLKAAGLTAGVRALFTTSAGKKFLMSASDISATSPKMDKLMSKVIEWMPHAVGRIIAEDERTK